MKWSWNDKHTNKSHASITGSNAIWLVEINKAEGVQTTGKYSKHKGAEPQMFNDFSAIGPPMNIQLTKSSNAIVFCFCGRCCVHSNF